MSESDSVVRFLAIRECQAKIFLSLINIPEVVQKADCLAAHVYRLIKGCKG